VANRLLADCFASYGFRNEAILLRETTHDLMMGGGCCAAFDAHGGDGIGVADSAEAAAVWLSWCGADEPLDLLTPA
jgi:hypothetical protein